MKERPHRGCIAPATALTRPDGPAGGSLPADSAEPPPPRSPASSSSLTACSRANKHSTSSTAPAQSQALPKPSCPSGRPRLQGSTPARATERRLHDRLPPGHAPGSKLPLGIVLHAFGGNHTSTFGGLSLARALAANSNRRGLAPVALVAPDGGRLYWNPHPGDNPMAMIVDELLPICQRLGLGAPPDRKSTR